MVCGNTLGAEGLILDSQQTLYSGVLEHGCRRPKVKMLVGVLDLNTMQLTYCNAGHPCPVVLSPKNGIRLLCVNPNVPVGVVDDYEFKEEYASLLTGDMVFLYTDGLIETENATHEVFGTKRMMLCLEKSLENGGTPEQIIERMTNNVEKFRANADRIDDAVMVVIKTL